MRIAAILATASWFFCFGFGFGCSGSSSTNLGASDAGDGGSALDGAGDAPLEAASGYTLDNVCDLIPAKVCAARQSCCASNGGYDQAGCEAREKDTCAKDVAEVRAGTMTFDGSKIDACLPILKKYEDKCFLTIDDLGKLAAEFNDCHVFSGKLADGAACDRDEQCKPAATANTFTGCDTTTKQCSTTTFLSIGSPCSLGAGVKSFCASGLFCDVDQTLNGSCKTATPLGQTCDKAKGFNLECGLGYYCDKTSGKCAVTLGGGAACGSDLECTSFSCQQTKCVAPKPIVDSKQCTGK